MASQSWHKAHYLATRITELDGWECTFDGDFFNEFTVNCPVDVTKIVNSGKKHGMLVGVAANGRRMRKLSTGNELIIAVTEKRTRHEMDSLVSLLKEHSS
jgi:glycine dehydrogenase subunit 1